MNICCYSKRKNNDLMTTVINFSDPKFVTNPEDQILLLHKLLWLQARNVVFLDVVFWDNQESFVFSNRDHFCCFSEGLSGKGYPEGKTPCSEKVVTP